MKPAFPVHHWRPMQQISKLAIQKSKSRSTLWCSVRVPFPAWESFKPEHLPFLHSMALPLLSLVSQCPSLFSFFKSVCFLPGTPSSANASYRTFGFYRSNILHKLSNSLAVLLHQLLPAPSLIIFSTLPYLFWVGRLCSSAVFCLIIGITIFQEACCSSTQAGSSREEPYWIKPKGAPTSPPATSGTLIIYLVHLK